MSNKILNLVRDARLGDPVMKEVLKVIADQSNDAGTGVWSSYAYIAWCIERGRSTVIKKCNELRKNEILSVTPRKGHTNIWTIGVERLTQLGVPYRDAIEVAETPPVPGLPQSQPETPLVQTGDPSPKEPITEPTYIADVDGVPAEHIMVYHDILAAWKEHFPKKTQPRATSTKLQGKVKARLKVSTFKVMLWQAMKMAKDSPSLMKDSWFQLEYLLRNDDNYEKVAAGEFNWKDGDTPRVTQPVVSETVDVEEWRKRRTNE